MHARVNSPTASKQFPTITVDAPEATFYLICAVYAMRCATVALDGCLDYVAVQNFIYWFREVHLITITNFEDLHTGHSQIALIDQKGIHVGFHDMISQLLALDSSTIRNQPWHYAPASKA